MVGRDQSDHMGNTMGTILQEHTDFGIAVEGIAGINGVGADRDVADVLIGMSSHKAEPDFQQAKERRAAKFPQAQNKGSRLHFDG